MQKKTNKQNKAAARFRILDDERKFAIGTGTSESRLPSFTGFYWVLLGFTEFYRVLLGFTGFYWVLPGFT